MENTYNVIMYTDGSAWPSSRGFYGGGVHGYLYCEKDLVEKSRDKHPNYFITEAGYISQEDIAKYLGKHINPSYYIDGAYSYHGQGTSNRGELNGVIETFKGLLDTKLKFDTISILADSSYTIGLLTHILNGNKDIFQDLNKPNRDLILELASCVNSLTELGVKINITYIEAHSTHLGNNIADRMAFIGRNKSYKGIAEITFNLSDGKNYWKPKFEKDPLINFKQIFFTNEARGLANKYIYTIMDYKTDVELGKKSSTATFGVVVKSKPVEEIETVIDAFQKGMGSYSVLSTINTKEVYTQANMLYSKVFGTSVYSFNRKNHYLTLVEQNVVANAINPPGLANQAMTKTMTLMQMLNTYKDYLLINATTTYRTFIDITSSIYGINDKNKPVTILPMIDGVLKIPVNIKGEEVIINMDIGTDTLSRNQFNQLVDKNVVVTLVIDQHTDKYLDYYMIVDVKDDDDIAVYCNFFSNKVFFKTK